MLGCDRSTHNFLKSKSNNMKKIGFKIALLIILSIIVTAIIASTHLAYIIFHN